MTLFLAPAGFANLDGPMSDVARASAAACELFTITLRALIKSQKKALKAALDREKRERRIYEKT